MIVSIHQPDFVPWLGFYYKVAKSDVFVYLDDAQFSNEAAHNFNDIKTVRGKTRIKIPVDYHFKDPIKIAKVKNGHENIEKMLRLIEESYKDAPFFESLFPEFKSIILHGYETISDLNIAINDWIFKGFGIKTKILKSSDMDIKSSREERVIDICVLSGASEYLSGNGARVYQTESHFLERGVKLSYLDYKPIRYKQLGDDFLPCMSVLDYLFNCGFNWEYVERSVERINKEETDF